MRRIALSLALLTAALAGQNPNSSRKIRTPPGEVAARAGSAVAWHDEFDAALAEAKAKDRLLFWYVPTVRRSPMDRQPEIDRYMRGGPFSWPTTIELLQRYTCLVRAPAGELQQRYELERGKFIEPGYLVLDGDGRVVLKVDQLTSFHPRWFEAPLRRLAQQPLEGFPGTAALAEAWQAYRGGDRAAAIASATAVLQQQPSDPVAAEAHWLVGAALCRDNNPRAARERWLHLAELLPEQPLAWKAALEAEGHGPFVHGFEDYLPLPDAVCSADPHDGTRVPANVYDEAELWRRSIGFLLTMDAGDGVIRDSTYDFGGTDGLPNVWAAVTCLAGMALLAAEERIGDGRLVVDAGIRARMTAMLGRIHQNARDNVWLAMSDKDEIVWARAYAVRFLAAWAQRHAGDGEHGPALRQAVGALFALQPETGAWFHEYGNPFATATALQALHDAAALDIELDGQRVAAGLAALAKNRTDEGAFSYGHTARGKPRASVIGSAGRIPLCEFALFLHGKSDQERLGRAVAAGLEHHPLLAAVRKYDDHADRYGYGGFFFWFDMLARTEAMLHLADAGQRAAAIARQREIVLALPEFDGCFVDSHELGRAYGTAMALLCLDATTRPAATSK